MERFHKDSELDLAAPDRLAKPDISPASPAPIPRHGAWADWWDGTRRIDIWWTLAWFDIVLRYRRSMLGPLWLTLSMGALIAGMGPLYGGLFKVDLAVFFPHLALGIIFWGLFSTIVSESCVVFVNSASYLKQAYFPISLFVWRSLARNLIIFAHQIVLYLPVAWWVGISISSSVWLVVPALLLTLVNGHAIGLMLGLLCTRYRDVTQIVNSVMQVLMFLTPVFWLPSSLPDRAQYVLWNPLAQLLDLLRTPLMGGMPAVNTWLSIMGWTLVNIAVASWLFAKYRRRVIYWL
jgi:lipopolysaccharide transport system permease protein